MKEAAPRIFRSLETPRGRAGFDTIVAAAVAAYGSLRGPTEAQARDFGRLVAPLWDRTEIETRRAISAALSHAPRVPRDLVDLLIDAPLEVSAPFLVSTPTLTVADVARIAARGDERVMRILAGRAERGLVSRPGGDEETVSRRTRRQVEAPPLSPDSLGDPVSTDASAPDGSAEYVRATLRRLARAGRPPVPRHQETVGQTLLRAARGGEVDAFFATLRALVDLGPADQALVEEDLGGHALARALKDLGLGTGEALAILMLVRPAVGLDVRAFEAMTRHYRSLEARAAPESLAEPSSAAPLRRSAERPSAETARPVRTPFGRRGEKPADGRRTSG